MSKMQRSLMIKRLREESVCNIKEKRKKSRSYAVENMFIMITWHGF